MKTQTDPIYRTDPDEAADWRPAEDLDIGIELEIKEAIEAAVKVETLIEAVVTTVDFFRDVTGESTDWSAEAATSDSLSRNES
jgi:hypothetical protein